MNNLQHIVKDNTRFAMHMAVELCEQGDFDSVTEALRWLMQEREAATPGNDACKLSYCEDGEGYDGWLCQSCGGWFDAVFRNGRLVEPKRCGCCGKAVRE